MRAFRVTDDAEPQADDAEIENVPAQARLAELDITPGHVVVEVEDEQDARLVDAIVASTRRGREVFERTVEAMTSESVPSQAAAEQMRRNADARHRVLAEYGTLTSEEVADEVGSRARNRAASAHRLQNAGKVFAVRHQGQTLFPAFQFAGGAVRTGVPEVLRVLHDRGLSGWEIALWFIAGSSFLGGRRPVDLLDEDQELVIEHAARSTPY